MSNIKLVCSPGVDDQLVKLTLDEEAQLAIMEAEHLVRREEEVAIEYRDFRVNGLPDTVDDETQEVITEGNSLKYPSLGEQLDMIFHAGLGGDTFQAAIQAVKDAHPKP